MPRLFRRTLAVAVLLGAWALVGSNHPPLPLQLSQAEAAPGDASGSVRGEKGTHDLSSLRVLTKVILYVKDNYVDPKRVRPKEMMVAALEYVEKTVPDVLVEGSAESGQVELNVNGKKRQFDISHVDSLWKMSFTLKDVFEFISKNMRPIEDTRDIEYAAVNGMLSTLDPHSVLLRPELYREMKLSTKGEFGGLGFVIQMKEGNLTVVRVLAKTPAFRADIKKDDTITKIGEESTVNMDLNEAVSKLRGPVDSKVTITVNRKGWDRPRVLTVARAMISIESVQHKLLSENVGYVRLKNFQGNTTRDLQAALEEMRAQAAAKGGFKGLVLDMRGNPGGLLDQAIQVSDTFVSQGTLVATVGYSDKLREEKRARVEEGEEDYPIVVLVNAGSASASEIVAGALKNLNRAVIVGRQTFGKGSVQVLYDFPDDSALKLTIAKYLTPGDVSIQEVGIVPDIQLVPTRVTPDRVNVFAPRRSMGEADLDQHFGQSATGPTAKKREEVLDREKPLETLRYLKEDAKGKDASAKAQIKDEGRSLKVLAGKKDEDAKHGEKDPLLDVDVSGQGEDLDDQLDAEAQDEIKEDFEVLFARDFVLKAPFGSRQKMLQAGKGFLDQKRREEDERINGALAGLGVDWSPGPTPKAVQLEARLTPGPEQKVKAGDLLPLTVTVENKGTDALKRVRAWTESDNVFLDRREFVFGALAPGQKKTWTVNVRLPKDLTSRRDDVTVKLQDDTGALNETVVSELNFVELPRPAFAFNWQVVDACAACNGDGVAQRGEELVLLLDVTNTGKGPALDSFASIKNAGDPTIFIEKGRFKLGALQPGETKTARFELQVKKPFKGKDFPLKLAVLDEPLEEFVTEKLQLPVADAPAAQLEPRKVAVRVPEKAELFASAQADARPVARLNKAAVLQGEAAGGGFVRVELDKERTVFVRSQDAKEARGAKVARADAALLTRRAPPDIQLDVDPNAGGVVAGGERYTLKGTVRDPNGLLDMYVLVNDQKVFFKAVDPAKGEPVELTFSTDFALKEGNNNVLVVARESTDFASRRTLVIRRRPPAVAQALNAAAQSPAQPTRPATSSPRAQ